MTHMTDQEIAVLDALIAAWDLFTDLPKENPDDAHEFRYDMHALQNHVLARPMRREINKAGYKPERTYTQYHQLSDVSKRALVAAHQNGGLVFVLCAGTGINPLPKSEWYWELYKGDTLCADHVYCVSRDGPPSAPGA